MYKYVLTLLLIAISSTCFATPWRRAQTICAENEIEETASAYEIGEIFSSGDHIELYGRHPNKSFDFRLSAYGEYEVKSPRYLTLRFEARRLEKVAHEPVISAIVFLDKDYQEIYHRGTNKLLIHDLLHYQKKNGNSLKRIRSYDLWKIKYFKVIYE